LLFVVFVVLRAAYRYFKKEIRGRELIVWLIFWAAVGMAILTPQTIDPLAQRVGVERGADLLLYISVLVLFYVVFKIMVKLENIDRQITKIVRQVALREEDKK